MVLRASLPPLSVNLLLCQVKEQNSAQSSLLPDTQRQLHPFGSQVTNFTAQSIHPHHIYSLSTHYELGAMLAARDALKNETDASHC